MSKQTIRLPGFRITDGKGFQITFDNGWTVSVQFGPGNYCEHHDAPIRRDLYVRCGEEGSSNAEVAVFDSDGNWMLPDQVEGWRSPTDVLELLNEVAALPLMETSHV